MSVLRIKTLSELSPGMAARNRSALSAAPTPASPSGLPGAQKRGGAAASADGGNDAAAQSAFSKYRNIKTVVDGITFHSKAESRRWSALRLMERAGEIQDIEMQIEYLLIPAQKKPGGGTERAIKYVCDFVYVRDGRYVVEDVKGMRTQDYVIKRKLMLHILGIEVMEIKA